MRILLNDFGGYPFPVQLSRELAGRGYVLLHCYVSNIQTPHGNMQKSKADSVNFNIEPVLLKRQFKKYSPVGRYLGEVEYANKITEKLDAFKPDIFLSANTPLFSQNILQKMCKKRNIKFIYWCQDIHSIAIDKFFKKRLPIIGNLFTDYFRSKEIKLLKQSDHIISIAESFNKVFEDWEINSDKLSTIYNWGPLKEIEILQKNNEWSKKHGLENKTVVLYSGTLGLKHNPYLIIEAAKNLKNNFKVVFVVISEGLGAEIIKKQKEILGLNNIIVLPYQEYNLLSQVLSSADILLAILEQDAGLYSVPSKVLSYLCSGKSILLSVPKDNLSAVIIVKNKVGYCSQPGNIDDFMLQLMNLIDDTALRNKMGENGRQYAVENFSIDLIAGKFINVFNKLKM